MTGKLLAVLSIYLFRGAAVVARPRAAADHARRRVRPAGARRAPAPGSPGSQRAGLRRHVDRDGVRLEGEELRRAGSPDAAPDRDRVVS
jgi:hypothetical protein